MVLQGLEKPFWPRLVQLKLKAHSFRLNLPKYWANLLEKVKKWLTHSSPLQERRSHQSSSLTKSTLCAAVDLKTKVRPQRELRHNFWPKCKELATMKMEFSFWERPTSHKLLILPFGEDLREEFTFLSLNMKQDSECSKDLWKTLTMSSLKATSVIWRLFRKGTQEVTSSPWSKMQSISLWECSRERTGSGNSAVGNGSLAEKVRVEESRKPGWTFPMRTMWKSTPSRWTTSWGLSARLKHRWTKSSWGSMRSGLRPSDKRDEAFDMNITNNENHFIKNLISISGNFSVDELTGEF